MRTGRGGWVANMLLMAEPKNIWEKSFAPGTVTSEPLENPPMRLRAPEMPSGFRVN